MGGGRPRRGSTLAEQAGYAVDVDAAKEAEHAVAFLLRGAVLAETWADERASRGPTPGDVILKDTGEVIEVKSVPSDRYEFVNAGKHRPRHRVVVFSRGSQSIRGWVEDLGAWSFRKPRPEMKACWMVRWYEVIGDDRAEE